MQLPGSEPVTSTGASLAVQGSADSTDLLAARVSGEADGEGRPGTTALEEGGSAGEGEHLGASLPHVDTPGSLQQQESEVVAAPTPVAPMEGKVGEGFDPSLSDDTVEQGDESTRGSRADSSGQDEQVSSRGAAAGSGDQSQELAEQKGGSREGREEEPRGSHEENVEGAAGDGQAGLLAAAGQVLSSGPSPGGIQAVGGEGEGAAMRVSNSTLEGEKECLSSEVSPTVDLGEVGVPPSTIVGDPHIGQHEAAPEGRAPAPSAVAPHAAAGDGAGDPLPPAVVDGEGSKSRRGTASSEGLGIHDEAQPTGEARALEGDVSAGAGAGKEARPQPPPRKRIDSRHHIMKGIVKIQHDRDHFEKLSRLAGPGGCAPPASAPSGTPGSGPSGQPQGSQGEPSGPGRRVPPPVAHTGAVRSAGDAAQRGKGGALREHKKGPAAAARGGMAPDSNGSGGEAKGHLAPAHPNSRTQGFHVYDTSPFVGGGVGSARGVDTPGPAHASAQSSFAAQWNASQVGIDSPSLPRPENIRITLDTQRSLRIIELLPAQGGGPAAEPAAAAAVSQQRKSAHAKGLAAGHGPHLHPGGALGPGSGAGWQPAAAPSSGGPERAPHDDGPVDALAGSVAGPVPVKAGRRAGASGRRESRPNPHPWPEPPVLPEERQHVRATAGVLPRPPAPSWAEMAEDPQDVDLGAVMAFSTGGGLTTGPPSVGSQATLHAGAGKGARGREGPKKSVFERLGPRVQEEDELAQPGGLPAETAGPREVPHVPADHAVPYCLEKQGRAASSDSSMRSRELYLSHQSATATSLGAQYPSPAAQGQGRQSARGGRHVAQIQPNMRPAPLVHHEDAGSAEIAAGDDYVHAYRDPKLGRTKVELYIPRRGHRAE